MNLISTSLLNNTILDLPNDTDVDRSQPPIPEILNSNIFLEEENFPSLKENHNFFYTRNIKQNFVLR
jgi:hypothetical protein